MGATDRSHGACSSDRPRCGSGRDRSCVVMVLPRVNQTKEYVDRAPLTVTLEAQVNVEMMQPISEQLSVRLPLSGYPLTLSLGAPRPTATAASHINHPERSIRAACLRRRSFHQALNAGRGTCRKSPYSERKRQERWRRHF